MRSSRALGALLAAAALTSSVAVRAHEFDEARRIVIALEGDRLDMVVGYELRAGELAEGLRAQFDAGADGRIETPFERLARRQVVGPRIGRAVRIALDGRPVRFAMTELAFVDAREADGRAGIAAVARFRAAIDSDATGERRLAVHLRAGAGTLEAQAGPGWRLASGRAHSSDVAADPRDPVWGPVHLGPGRPAALTFVRAAQSHAGD
ncbi:MAG: hypothetical protein AB7S26_33840 [Sandaracinaceae bacterium]